jgi:YbbR domain-containing protein
MKKISTKENIGLRILALFLSVLLWVYVILVEQGSLSIILDLTKK